MSYHTWHTYGYGVEVTKLSVVSVDRFEELLGHAPQYAKRVHAHFDDCEIRTPTVDDYFDFEAEFEGMASFIGEVINEAEGIELVSCDDFDCRKYLLYTPEFPWYIPEKEKGLTEEKVRQLFFKYLSILTDDDIFIDYYEVENGG